MKHTQFFYVARERTYHRDITVPTLEARNLATGDLIRLRNINRKLQRINEDDCNGNPQPVVEIRDGKRYEYDIQDEKRAARNEKTETRLEKEAEAIAARWGWAIRIQGDPRGSAIKLDLLGGDVDYIGADTDIIC
jgi:hypothetical protein